MISIIIIIFLYQTTTIANNIVEIHVWISYLLTGLVAAKSSSRFYMEHKLLHYTLIWEEYWNVG